MTMPPPHPRFSIITACYNAASTLGSTICSVLSQDFAELEHIVVDGQSTDQSVGVASSFADRRLRILSGPDRGVYDAMNKGAAVARGEYLLFLNADDLFATSTALSLIAAAADATRAPLICWPINFFGQNTRRTRPWTPSPLYPRLAWLGIVPPPSGNSNQAGDFRADRGVRRTISHCRRL